MNYRLVMPLVLLLPVLISGCNNLKAWYATEFRQADVTSGIARLSAQHLSVIASELGKQFKEPDVAIEIIPATDAKDFGKGTVVKTIENFVIDAPSEKVVLEDCLGTKGYFRGKVEIVKATQTMFGRLTNNPQNPIIPDANTVKMTIHAKPMASVVRFSDKEEYMEIDNGELQYDVYPRLAQAQTGALKGLRVIPTSNTRYENVTMKGVNGTLFTGQVSLPFDIATSNMHMQIGAGEDGQENKLGGEILAFGNLRKVPVDGDALNPNYTSEDFMKTYACNENFQGVVAYNNELFEERIGPGMAGLTTLAMSKIAAKLADDHECGMASVAFLRGTTLSGDPLELGGSRSTLPSPCKVTFTNYRTEPDCFGVAHEINGEAVVVSASKDMSGLVFLDQSDFSDSIDAYEKKLSSGNIAEALSKRPEPVLPKSRQPAVIDFTADVSNLVVTEICIDRGSVDHEAHCNRRDQDESPLTFKLHEGRVSATLKPVMGKSIDENDDRVYMCAVRSLPIADTMFRLEGVNASIARAGNEFHVYADGTYRAVNGKINEQENELSGEMMIGKVAVRFASHDKEFLPLKPDYEAQRFEESFMSCAENKFIVPSNDSDCSLVELGL